MFGHAVPVVVVAKRVIRSRGGGTRARGDDRDCAQWAACYAAFTRRLARGCVEALEGPLRSASPWQ